VSITHKQVKTVDFLIVGMPRSGTTLLQRLACELPGVRVPPETHFFRAFARKLMDRRSFPLSREAIIEEISNFTELPTSAGLDLDGQAIADSLGGTCESPFELFCAVVGQLAGPSRVLGEKTPAHLRWWRPLSAASPSLRFVGLIRDPRAVVASNLRMKWSSRFSSWGSEVHVPFAEQWRASEELTRAMQAQLGPERVLVFRYEDVVTDPDDARSRLARFLSVSVPSDEVPAAAPSDIIMERESWKSSALGPVDPGLRDAWLREGQLSKRQYRQISTICRSGAKRWGYAVPSTLVTRFAGDQLDRQTSNQLDRFRSKATAELDKITAMSLGPVSTSG
jgi:hypothetical protein